MNLIRLKSLINFKMENESSRYNEPLHPRLYQQPPPSQYQTADIVSALGPELEDDSADKIHPSKLDILILNNGWNDKNEKLLVSIGENAESLKWMHSKSATQYRLYAKILSLLIIVLNAGLSAQSILSFIVSGRALDYTQKIFIFINTILSVVANFLSYDESAIEHHNAAAKFSKIYHEIQQQMCMYRKDRPNAIEYVRYSLQEYDSTNIASPDINDRVLGQFKRLFQNTDISIPNIADRLHKIDIITDPLRQPYNSGENQGPVQSQPQDQSQTARVESQDTTAGKQISISIASNGIKNKSNLKSMSECFRIDGDIDESDAATIVALDTRKKAFKDMSDYQMQRFMTGTE